MSSSNQSTSNQNPILVQMLDRLFAGLMSGPNLNCRPHSSRQRIDLNQLTRLHDGTPCDALKALLSAHQTQFVAKVSMPKSLSARLSQPFVARTNSGSKSSSKSTDAKSEEQLSPEEKKNRDAWTAQQALLTKLRGLAEDSRDYEQDTGVHALHVGFPLLSLPPGTAAAIKGKGGSAKRLLAPIAYVPVSVALKPGSQPVFCINAQYSGADFLIPNEALFAWLERQTGKKLLPDRDLQLSDVTETTEASDADAAAISDAFDPWIEINDLVRRVAEVLNFTPPTYSPESLTELVSAPRSDDDNPQAAIVPTAVLGLFPMHNQGLLRDMQAMVAGESLEGPIRSFLNADISLMMADIEADDEANDIPSDATTQDPAAVQQSDSAATSDDIAASNETIASDDISSSGNSNGEMPALNTDVVSVPLENGVAESPTTEGTLVAATLDSTPLADVANKPDTAASLSGSMLGATSAESTDKQPITGRKASTERLATVADPCQSQAVRLARACRGLVIHGPPGTGKSQTITNIIGDHLARGERVLLVCDKRTALDVVARRLEHLGLGDLCALIHDPQHDQRYLYKSIREQLESLTETKIKPRNEKQLDKLDTNLQRIYDELAEAWSLVMSPREELGASFHERMGEWLEAALPFILQPKSNESSNGQSVDSDGNAESTENKTEKKRARRQRANKIEPAEPVEPATAIMLDQHDTDLREIIKRASDCQYVLSAWRDCAGLTLDDFLSRPMSSIRDAVDRLVDAADDADETVDDCIPPFFHPQVSGLSFTDQATARQVFAEQLERCLNDVSNDWRQRWLKASAANVIKAEARLRELQPVLETMRQLSLDPMLKPLTQTPSSITQIDEQIGELQEYIAVSGTWVGWFSFGRRGRANAIAKQYGLRSGLDSIKRLHRFLTGWLSRRLIADALTEFASNKNYACDPLDDEALEREWSQVELMVSTLLATSKTPALNGLTEAAKELLKSVTVGATSKANRATSASASNSDDASNALIDGLRNSVPRAECMQNLLEEIAASGLLSTSWQQRVIERLCRGDLLAVEMEQLAAQVDSLSDVLRIESGLAALPTPLRAVVTESLLKTQSSDDALNSVRYQVLTSEISLWLQSNRKLQAIDGERRSTLFSDAWRFEAEKRELVCDVIRDYWVARQRDRLLASTGSRLSSLGADLKRRLTMRGDRALRLRQVVAIGDQIEDGDPLFDMRPVWMASPETVAQIFPRRAMFDVVIFDEASQCRLEEALPVLTRAKRVVIAGDPKQLPPTRFFQSASVNSEHQEIENEQQLFEVQQSGVEDLLAAALMLDMQQCYLDVHYRSQNSDLIEFSNEQFYDSRLQALPGHPRHRVRFSPITLHRANGIYHERANVIEAERVSQIVADLLRRSEPPSIGIACFNITQRDLILDKLDELADTDSEFRDRLAAARLRTGKGAFEGLFVKNLENVQGDERDHIIISTTYGPAENGKFYRRFGPLGQAGGGRRLNVLVTRARQEVHLVTSIPADVYRNLPPVPSGQQPGGAWLLFAYLSHAEQLADEYEQWRKAAAESSERTLLCINERPTATPSRLSLALAKLMAARHQLGSDVHRGNDGFCIDVAFHHPERIEDRTLGLLIDGTRFTGSADPVEWDLFRTQALAIQGWDLRAVATPQLFRDLDGHLERFVREASQIARTQTDPDSIPVELN